MDTRLSDLAATMRNTLYAALFVGGGPRRGGTSNSGTNWFVYCELYNPLEVAGLEEHFEN